MRLLAASPVLILAACQTAPAVESTAMLAEPPKVVATTCAQCHAVRPGEFSPRAGAPRFVDVANTPGLTRETFAAFLSDAHNYPQQMDVHLSEQNIADISDYMVSLQDPDYKRMPM